jgi:hypothetical protein
MITTTDRVNGTARTTSRRPTTTTRKPSRATIDKAARKATLHKWAMSYVFLAVALSCLLNGYDAYNHAPESSRLLGTLAGGLIPVLVLILGKVAGLAHHCKFPSWVVKTVGGVGCCVLALSVFHCSAALAALTGSNMVLAILLAIGIDCGLVACELVALLSE